MVPGTRQTKRGETRRPSQSSWGARGQEPCGAGVQTWGRWCLGGTTWRVTTAECQLLPQCLLSPRALGLCPEHGCWLLLPDALLSPRSGREARNKFCFSSWIFSFQTWHLKSCYWPCCFPNQRASVTPYCLQTWIHMLSCHRGSLQSNQPCLSGQSDRLLVPCSSPAWLLTPDSCWVYTPLTTVFTGCPTAASPITSIPASLTSYSSSPVISSTKNTVVEAETWGSF